jgi:enoyl-CoA hydratase/carnithine racemase
MALGRFVELASGGASRLELATTGGAVVVDLAGAETGAGDGRGGAAAGPAMVASLPVVIVGLRAGARASRRAADLVDVVVDGRGAAARVVEAVSRRPIAATALALLLRGAEHRTVPAGLVAESSTYSLLQAGPEHQAWLRDRDRSRLAGEPPQAAGEPVLVERRGRELHVTLHRPEVHNALDAAMRDALLDALAIAAADPGLRVEIAGSGPSFCSGGDLREFGTLADPASAHLLRLGRSVGHAIHALADRVTVAVHGHCVGSGLELAAFAGRVVADPHTTFALPELSLGLVPGAGGTVSVSRRIGRHRTAWLALTGSELDAAEAQAWGLVDDIRPVEPRRS